MATMYALPTLSNWYNNGTFGWSDTSGGSDNGTHPTSTTDVVFDSNSGSARTITIIDGAGSGSVRCKSISTAAATSGFSFTGSTQFDPSGNVDLTGVTGTLLPVVCSSVVSITLKVPNATLNSLTCNSTSITLLSDLNVAGQLITQTSFDANNFNVKCNDLYCASGTGTLTMGSGTWELTGSSTVWSVYGFTSLNCNTSTIKITGNSNIAHITFAGNGHTYYKLQNAISGTGHLTITGGNTFDTLQIDPGRTQWFAASYTNTLTNLIADGTSSQISIRSDSTATQATLNKSGGGSIYLDYFTIQDITASPSNTWKARNSVDVSNNSGIEFIPRNSAFAYFF